MVYITNTSSFFINDTALFGAFPTQKQIDMLELWGVDIIIDLTSHYEKKIKPYQTSCPVLRFVIPDRCVPENFLVFFGLVVWLADVINNKKIYIHCKGGHGRSSLLVCSLLCFINKISPEEAFDQTSKYHSERILHSVNPKRNEYWKTRGFPQNNIQKRFILDMFNSYNIPKHSPFVQENSWLSGEYDDFLMRTGLGSISGKNGAALEQYRNTLLKRIAVEYFNLIPPLLPS